MYSLIHAQTYPQLPKRARASRLVTRFFFLRWSGWMGAHVGFYFLCVLLIFAFGRLPAETVYQVCVSIRFPPLLIGLFGFVYCPLYVRSCCLSFLFIRTIKDY